MAAACYPEAAEKVREELDAVIGKERRAFLVGAVVVLKLNFLRL